MAAKRDLGGIPQQVGLLVQGSVGVEVDAIKLNMKVMLYSA